MGRSKQIIFGIFLLVFLFGVAHADVTYTLQNALSTSTSVLHGGSTPVRYQILNQNFACPVYCTVRMVSDYYSTPQQTFTLSADALSVSEFSLKAPMKAEANYQPDGSVSYSLDLSCNRKSSLIPLCSQAVEMVTSSQSDSKKFTLNYDLSPLEKQTKKNYDSLVLKQKDNIQEAYNRGKELQSYLSNLQGKVKISSSDVNEINAAVSLSQDAYAAYTQSQEDYKKLEIVTAFSGLSKYETTDFQGVQTSVASLRNRLEKIQKQHNEATKLLSVIKLALLPYGIDAPYTGLATEYGIIAGDYASNQKSLDDLSFSSYDSLMESLNDLFARLETFKKTEQQKEAELKTLLNSVLMFETTKIESPHGLTSATSISDSVKSFCRDITVNIPVGFRTYNTEHALAISRQNEANAKFNERLEILRPQWNVLEGVVKDINAVSKDAVFDQSLVSGCSLDAIVQDSVDKQVVESTIGGCTQFKEKLSASVEENKKLSKSFLNFFKYIFSKKPQLNQKAVVPLDSLRKSTNLVYTPVVFEKSTEQLIQEKCNLSPKSVVLNDPKSVEGIGFIASNTKLQASSVQGTCEKLNCYGDRKTFPVLFVHGHLFKASDDPMVASRYTFDGMIGRFADKYTNTFDAGTIVDKGSKFLDPGIKSSPRIALFRTTYYGNAYIDPSGNFQFEKKNYETITEYANKLNRIVDATLETTGRQKVKIVAHSMGGLVVREYLRLYGNDKVDTFIMIGTPNQGVEGEIRDNCEAVLGLIPAGAETECSQMAKGNEFLRTLTQKDNLPPRTYIISGTYQNEETDAIVLKKNTQISGIKQYNYPSSKTYVATIVNKLLSNALVHNDLVDPNYMPEVSDKVAELLEIK